MGFLQNIDMYRKVPKDLSKGTVTGATLSLIGTSPHFSISTRRWWPCTG